MGNKNKFKDSKLFTKKICVDCETRQMSYQGNKQKRVNFDDDVKNVNIFTTTQKQNFFINKERQNKENVNEMERFTSFGGL